MKTRCFIICLSLSWLITDKCLAQDAAFKDSSVTAAAGPQFKASGWKEFWWGKHYRDEWTAPVKFPVIDINATAGGLTPTKRGGGHETKSLRLIGANGKEYVLRTMDKDLSVLIPENFKQSFVTDIVNDQVCTAHPYGPVVVSKLSAVAGVNHTNPVIVYVPHSKTLGAFDSIFAGKLCLFEERPSGEGWNNTALTGYADDIVNTEDLLKDLKEDNDKKVDQEAFLKIRLFDIWINDWDRHEDQWVWTAYTKNGKTIYTPFARDRDQSFSKTDGVNLYFLSRPWALRILQNMKDNVSDVIGTTFEARYLDKQFLNELTKDDWKKVIAQLQASLTDKGIEDAVHNLPDTVMRISGQYLIDKLIARRNNMMEYGMHYYDILNKEADITGTDKKEYFTINNISPDETEITVQKINKENTATDTVYHKIFNHSETYMIYLYGLSGDDIFLTKNHTSNKIKLTVIGGAGNDAFIEGAENSNRKKICVYDDKTNPPEAASVYKTHFTDDTLKINYRRTHFVYDWYAPLIVPGYNPDDGFFLGAGFIYKKQHWGKKPYAWQQAFGVSAAFKTGATSFFYSGKFTRLAGPFDLDLHASYKGPQYVFNFYGYGNDTKLLTDDKAYNRVRVKQLIVNPALAKTFSNQEIKFGLVAEHLNVEDNTGKFISDEDAGIDSIVFEGNTFLGADVSYTLGKVNDEKFPSKGFRFEAGATYKKNVTHGEKDFVNLNGDFVFYLPLSKVVLAHRSGVATNIGDYEFYHANYLGGNTNLRGYYRSRFAGKTSFYQNTELRVVLATIHGYALRGKFGIYGFFDDGRVWVENDDSNTLHTGYGGGMFFMPFNSATINFSYGSSKEKNTVLFGLNFFF